MLRAWSAGEDGAANRLVPAIYQQLRRRAVAYLRGERHNHTLQPTALVHEAYLRLDNQQHVVWENRAQFFGLASQMMRRILVDHARRRHMHKRSGQWIRVSLRRLRVAGPSGRLRRARARRTPCPAGGVRSRERAASSSCDTSADSRWRKPPTFSISPRGPLSGNGARLAPGCTASCHGESPNAGGSLPKSFTSLWIAGPINVRRTWRRPADRTARCAQTSMLCWRPMNELACRRGSPQGWSRRTFAWRRPRPVSRRSAH